MPQLTYRANLSAAIFPLSVQQAGRSVIIPGADNVYDRRIDPEGEQKNAGIPQAIYMENVVPTAEGYQSVGYIAKNSVPKVTVGITPLPVVRVLRFGDYALAMRGATIGFSDFTAAYTSMADGANWTINPALGTAIASSFRNANTPVIFTIRGVNYIFTSDPTYSAARTLFSFDDTVSSGSFVDEEPNLVGIDIVDIDFMLASHNYMIAIKSTGEVAWSSTTTPLDFTPSLITGAGSATPNELNSRIIAAFACPEGFILYTKTNTIGVFYTGNSRYPWKFKEIINGGAYSDATKIAAVKGSQYHYAIDVHGTLRVIGISEAKEIASEVSTWIRTCYTQDRFNSTTSTLESELIVDRNFTIYYLMQRYIVVGGNGRFVIYDMLLKRYGKLNKFAAYFWEYGSGIYCVTTGGDTFQLSFDFYNTSAVYDALLMLGKFQLTRGRRIELQEMIVEGTRALPVGLGAFTPTVLASPDGKSFGTSAPLTDSTPLSMVGARQYKCRAEGQNVSVILRGPFDVSTVELVFTTGAAR